MNQLSTHDKALAYLKGYAKKYSYAGAKPNTGKNVRHFGRSIDTLFAMTLTT